MTTHDHEGHRQRMRERFEKSGLEGFASHEVLELLLFAVIPRRNVNPIAHKLLRHFGTLAAVLEATPTQLTQVPGIGASSAALISLILPMARYAELERQEERAIITNLREARAYCQHLFAGKADEVLYVICLDAQGRVLHAAPAIHGTIDEIPLYPRTIVEIALRHHAYSVVLAHNHPSGVAEPSIADIQATAMLREVLSGVSITLFDHLVFAEGECASIAQWQKNATPTLVSGRTQAKAADTKHGPARKRPES